jgi:hypothetical protein
LRHSINCAGILQRIGIKQGWSECSVNCAADDVGFQDLVERCLRKIQWRENPSDYGRYPTTVSVASLIQLPPEYYRAIAKIVFHFFLWCGFPHITGFGREFEAIKWFIWQGGDPRDHVRSTWDHFDRDHLGDARYAHLLAGGISTGQALAIV